MGFCSLKQKPLENIMNVWNMSVIPYSQGNEDIYNNCHNLLRHMVP
jgi:hypothetical protein